MNEIIFVMIRHVTPNTTELLLENNFTYLFLQ